MNVICYMYFHPMIKTSYMTKTTLILIFHSKKKTAFSLPSTISLIVIIAFRKFSSFVFTITLALFNSSLRYLREIQKEIERER